jgi:hypothetical protein
MLKSWVCHPGLLRRKSLGKVKRKAEAHPAKNELTASLQSQPARIQPIKNRFQPRVHDARRSRCRSDGNFQARCFEHCGQSFDGGIAPG